MARLITEKDSDRDGPIPCQSSAQTSPSRRRFLDDNDLEVLLRKAGLALDSPAAGETGCEEGSSGQGGRRASDGDCRVGQCRMSGMIQRLATVHFFTAMCCALAALTGNSLTHTVVINVYKRFCGIQKRVPMATIVVLVVVGLLVVITFSKY